MLLQLALLLLMGADNPPLDVKVLRTVTVCEAEEHLNFPWVFRGPDGFLSLSCSIGQHTVTERSQALVSSDDGETWTTPGEAAPNGMATLLRDGRAAVCRWRARCCRKGAGADSPAFQDETPFSPESHRNARRRTACHTLRDAGRS